MTVVAQQAGKQLAWSPSRPYGQLALDYTRRLLICDLLGCGMKVIRSQEELQQELVGKTEMRVVHRRQSSDGGKTWITTDVTVPAYATPVRMILGGCFGGDLPFSTATHGGDLRVVNANAAKPVAASEIARSHQ